MCRKGENLLFIQGGIHFLKFLVTFAFEFTFSLALRGVLHEIRDQRHIFRR